VRVCSFPSCKRLHKARGFCEMHYLRLKSHGDPSVRKRRAPVLLSLSELMARTTMSSDGCWNWNGALNTSGYAWMSYLGRSRIVSRVAWELENGPISVGLCVLHRCDNRKCINPSHLFLGDNLTNQRDMIAKGRGRKAFGSRSGVAKLNEQLVVQMREAYSLGSTPTDIARQHGLPRSTVWHALNKRTWRHV